MRKAHSQSLLAVTTWLAASVAFTQQAESGNRDFQQAVQDAWIDGRLESAYIFNEHLSAAAIDTDVRNGAVTLTGTVESDIDRDLAGAIAEGLNGVVSVDNSLRVAGERQDVRRTGAAGASDPEAGRDADADERRSFGQWVNDATTSAVVKSSLIRNENIRARDIDVNTQNDIVTLRGVVATEQQKELAEQLAKNTQDVKEVRNELRVEVG